MQISAFEVNVKGKDWQTVVNSSSAGRAKSEYLLDVQDAWPSVKYTDITVRKIGGPVSSERFRKTCEHRGLKINCGDEIFVDKNRGYIVGSDPSANIRVLFDKDSGWPNLVLSVHPGEIKYNAKNQRSG